MKCKTCSHPQRQAIDHALLARTRTLEALSQHYGLSTSSLFRHKQHLVENLDRARDRLRNSQQLGHLLKLNGLLDQVERAVDAADADGDVDRVLRGAGVGARIIQQMSRMDVTLDLDTVYRIISSPQWVSQASLLPTGPDIITGIHQTLADIAFFPCPEIPLERANEENDNDEDGEDSETIPETTNSKLRTQNPELFSQLQQLLARLSLAGADDLEITPKIQREKSAKLPKNSPLLAENNNKIQIDNQCEKNLAKNPVAGRESEAPPACMESKAPAAANYSSPSLMDLNTQTIARRETANGKRQTVFETGSQKPETVFIENRNSELRTQDSERLSCCQEDCIIPLKNERYRQGGIY